MIDPGILLMNILYTICGAVLTIVFMVCGYKIFDKITPFDTGEELHGKNTAVGMVIGAMFIGLGIAAGLVIGLGLH